MNLETKKRNVVQLISSIKSEKIIDQINEKIIQLLPEEELTDIDVVSKYAGNLEGQFNLEKIIAEQNYKGIDLKKMEKLRKDANIKESIGELLEMLD